MKLCGAAIMAAFFAATVMAKIVTKGSLFNDQEMQIIELVNVNRAELPLSDKTVQLLDKLINLVCWQQEGFLISNATSAVEEEPTGAGIPHTPVLNDAISTASLATSR